jgi:hypothetical protein
MSRNPDTERRPGALDARVRGHDDYKTIQLSSIES